MHYLHAGIAEKQRGSQSTARGHFVASSELRPNALASYCLGDLASAWEHAVTAINASTGEDAFAVALGRDTAGILADSLSHNGSFSELAELISSIQTWRAHMALAGTTILRSQPMRIAAVAVALYHASKPHTAIRLLLAPEAWAVSTPDLVPLWYDAWFAIEMPTNALDQVHVRRRHPPPSSIDFRGAT